MEVKVYHRDYAPKTVLSEQLAYYEAHGWNISENKVKELRKKKQAKPKEAVGEQPASSAEKEKVYTIEGPVSLPDEAAS